MIYEFFSTNTFCYFLSVSDVSKHGPIPVVDAIRNLHVQNTVTEDLSLKTQYVNEQAVEDVSNDTSETPPQVNYCLTIKILIVLTLWP